MAPNTDWPHLLAAVTAERDALNQVIEILTKRFVRDEETTGPTRSQTRGRPKKAVRRTDGRTDGRSKARASTRSLPSAPEPP